MELLRGHTLAASSPAPRARRPARGPHLRPAVSMRSTPRTKQASSHLDLKPGTLSYPDYPPGRYPREVPRLSGSRQSSGGLARRCRTWIGTSYALLVTLPLYMSPSRSPASLPISASTCTHSLHDARYGAVRLRSAVHRTHRLASYHLVRLAAPAAGRRAARRFVRADPPSDRVSTRGSPAELPPSPSRTARRVVARSSLSRGPPWAGQSSSPVVALPVRPA